MKIQSKDRENVGKIEKSCLNQEPGESQLSQFTHAQSFFFFFFFFFFLNLAKFDLGLKGALIKSIKVIYTVFGNEE